MKSADAWKVARPWPAQGAVAGTNPMADGPSADTLTGGDWLSQVAAAQTALAALEHHRNLCASLASSLSRLLDGELRQVRTGRRWRAFVAVRRLGGGVPADPLRDVEALLQEQLGILAQDSDSSEVPAAVAAICSRAEEILCGTLLRSHAAAAATVAMQRLRAMSELIDAGRPQGFPGNWTAAKTDAPTPVVSIIVVAFDNAALVELCVASVLASNAGAAWELLIANNSAPQPSLARLSRLDRRIRLVDIGVNRGFGEACNIAAERARGTHLVFLNADAFVSDGWLGELVDVYDRDLALGILAATLVSPDGTVQEAGCRVDSAGRVWQNGRGEDLSSIAQRRPVDAEHVSAACSMISKELFELLGGFDWRYYPAYCEDLDLSFKVRAGGLRVMYHEAVRVVHLEHGGDSSPRAIAAVRVMVEANRLELVRKWGIDDSEPVADRYSGFDAVPRTDRGAFRNTLAASHASGIPETGSGAFEGNGATPRYALHNTIDMVPGVEQAALLDAAGRLAGTGAQVTLVSAAPWSRLRLRAVSQAVGFSPAALLSRITVASETEVAASDFDAVYRLGESGPVQDSHPRGW